MDRRKGHKESTLLILRFCRSEDDDNGDNHDDIGDNGDNDDNDDDNKDDDDDTVGQLVYHKICFIYVSMTHILHIFSR